MVKVVWTQRALYDLEDIADYISKDSVRYASLTLEKILDTATIIESNPLIGRIVPETNDKNIREIIKGNYRVIYFLSNDQAANILTVFHTARLLTRDELK
jgi:toxin ParE1/3/4